MGWMAWEEGSTAAPTPTPTPAPADTDADVRGLNLDKEGQGTQPMQGSGDEEKQTFGDKPLGKQVLEVGWYVVGLTTVWSGLSYVGWGRRKGLRILSEGVKKS